MRSSLNWRKSPEVISSRLGFVKTLVLWSIFILLIALIRNKIKWIQSPIALTLFKLLLRIRVNLNIKYIEFKNLLNYHAGAKKRKEKKILAFHSSTPQLIQTSRAKLVRKFHLDFLLLLLSFFDHIYIWHPEKTCQIEWAAICVILFCFYWSNFSW